MTTFPTLDPAFRLRRLAWPTAGRVVRAVLDTDTYNEVDDQFALAYALLATERIDLQAVYAAPFHNRRSSGPTDGMQRSYEEILRVLERMGEAAHPAVLKGSERFLARPDEPVASAAAEDLARRGMEGGADDPLYVLAIAAATNVASALLLEPRLVERIVVVWLGGHPYHWPHTREFNLMQDVPAASLLFDSGVPLVHIPCKHVAEHLRTTLPELAALLRDKGETGRYLYDIVRDYAPPEAPAWSKVIWDIATVAWLLDETSVPSVLEPSPLLNPGLTWSRDPARHPLRVAVDCNRDAVFSDLFKRLDEKKPLPLPDGCRP